MKLFTKAILLACCITIISSCKKDGISPNNFVSYKIDGVAKKAKPDALYFSGDNSILLDGSGGSDDITLFINSNIAPGTYQIDSLKNGTIGAMYVNWDNSIFYNSISGTLVIDSYNGSSISGSFQFAASDDNGVVRNITEGKFSTKIEEYTGSSDSGDNYDDSGDYSDTTSNSGCQYNSWGVNHNTKLAARYLHLKQLRKTDIKFSVHK